MECVAIVDYHHHKFQYVDQHEHAIIVVGLELECTLSQCLMDPMVMGNQRPEKSEELRLLYYLRIYGDTPPTIHCVQNN